MTDIVKLRSYYELSKTPIEVFALTTGFLLRISMRLYLDEITVAEFRSAYTSVSVLHSEHITRIGLSSHPRMWLDRGASTADE